VNSNIQYSACILTGVGRLRVSSHHVVYRAIHIVMLLYYIRNTVQYIYTHKHRLPNGYRIITNPIPIALCFIPAEAIGYIPMWPQGKGCDEGWDGWCQTPDRQDKVHNVKEKHYSIQVILKPKFTKLYFVYFYVYVVVINKIMGCVGGVVSATTSCGDGGMGGTRWSRPHEARNVYRYRVDPAE
jgi:hypothetical protein